MNESESLNAGETINLFCTGDNYRMNTQILNGYDTYVVFGTKIAGMEALKQLSAEGVQVRCFSDNDSKSWNTEVCGIPVIEPSGLTQIKNVLVIIASAKYKYEIAAQMDDIGVPYVFYSKPIFIELTSYCNQKCTFCPYEYIERKKGHLDWEFVKAFLYDLISEKSDVLFPIINPHVMGEPLLYRQFFDFLDLCKELGLYTVVTTNFALLDEEKQERLFKNYDNLDIILSLGPPVEEVFHWRKEPKLTYNQWIDRLFEVIKAKFKYGFKGQIEIMVASPETLNRDFIQSDSASDVFKWYSSAEEYKAWKKEFGQRCLDLVEDVKIKYPENYSRMITEEPQQPIEFFYPKGDLKHDLEQWVKSEGLAQFQFLPNVFIFQKSFGVWGSEKLLRTLISDDKYIYFEEDWYKNITSCDRCGDVAVLSSGEIAVCNVDNEGDFVVADMNKGEKYTDRKSRERLKMVRDNLPISTICRRCAANFLIFDTEILQADTQEITHYGRRWHPENVNRAGESKRDSYEISSIYVLPRIEANSLCVDMESVQNKRQFTLIKILCYDDETRFFTEYLTFSEQLKPYERKTINIPYSFEHGKLHRIDFITATQRVGNADHGVAVYSATIKK